MFLLTNPPQHPFSSSGLSSKMSHSALPWHLVSFPYAEGSCPSVSRAPQPPLRPANSVKVFFCVVYPSLLLSSSKIKTIPLGNCNNEEFTVVSPGRKRMQAGWRAQNLEGNVVFNTGSRPPFGFFSPKS